MARGWLAGAWGRGWQGCGRRMRADGSWGARAGKLFQASAAAARAPLGRAESPAAGPGLGALPAPGSSVTARRREARRRGLGPAGYQGRARPGLGLRRGRGQRPGRGGAACLLRSCQQLRRPRLLLLRRRRAPPPRGATSALPAAAVPVPPPMLPGPERRPYGLMGRPPPPVPSSCG